MSEIKTLSWLFRRIRRRLPALLLLILFDAVGALLGVCSALGTREVINSATGCSLEAFLWACGLQFFIILGIVVCSIVARYISGRLRSDLDRDWKKRLFHGLLQGKYAAVSAYHSGELINRLNNDVRILVEGIAAVVPNSTSLVIRLVTAMATLFAIAPKLTAALLVFGVIAVLATGFVRKRMKSLHRRANEAEGKVMSFLQENLEKLLAVQAMDLSEQVECRADTRMEERYQIQRQRRNTVLAVSTCTSMVFQLCGFGALAWCGYRLLRGMMDFGTLTAVTQLVNQVKIPIVNVSAVLPQYTAMLAAAERLRELDEVPRQEESAIEDAAACYASLTGFRTEALTFAYEEENVLENVDIFIPKGSFCAITGPSGIGKSTLLKLMLGIYIPQKGGIFADIKEEKLKLGRGTRRLFAYVPQGNFLFSGTLRENLMMIAPDAGEEQLQEAIYVSAMDLFIDQLPEGLDTVIGEHGDGLSEGQAQRISIARAVLSGAPVLLLDEATSALDSETEKLVLQRVCAMPNRTCIAVTHRPAALEQADYQLCVNERKIEVVSLR